MTDGEKVKALNLIADRIVASRQITHPLIMNRFVAWGDTASTMFLMAMEKEGYELVRKEDA